MATIFANEQETADPSALVQLLDQSQPGDFVEFTIPIGDLERYQIALCTQVEIMGNWPVPGGDRVMCRIRHIQGVI